MIVHIEYLYYFQDFTKTLSISKTASNFYMTPQGLSRAIHQLEKDFGVTLTSYQGNAISLTPAGYELGRRVDSIINCVEEARGALEGYRLAELGGHSGESVRITVTSCVSQYAAALLDIQKPGLFPFNVIMRESDVYNVIPHIESVDGEGSFAIVSIPNVYRYRAHINRILEEFDVVYEPLFASPLVALVSTYSPLAKKKSITPRDVDSCWVARYQDAVLADALDDFIREDRIKTVTNAVHIIYSRIIEDQAISFAPKLVDGMETLPEKVAPVPAEGFFDTEFGLLAFKSELESPSVAQVVDYIKKKVVEEHSRGRYAGSYYLFSDPVAAN